MTSSELPVGARCGRHPELPAASLCARCGNFACTTCTVEREAGTYCASCSRRFFGLGGSWTAVVGAILGFVGIGCPPTGPVAIVLGVVDLARIGAKRAPSDGWKLDAIAIVAGAIGTALWAYIVWLHFLDPAGPPPVFPDGY